MDNTLTTVLSASTTVQDGDDLPAEIVFAPSARAFSFSKRMARSDALYT